MMERVGLKNMVIVAAACLVSRGILKGARRERAVRGWSPGNRNGPRGARKGRE